MLILIQKENIGIETISLKNAATNNGHKVIIKFQLFDKNNPRFGKIKQR